MKSIEDTRGGAKRQITPLKSAPLPTQPKTSKDFFEPLCVSSQQFRFFFEDLPVGIALNKVVYDNAGVPIDFVTLEVNPEYENALGLNREQLLNKRVAEFYPQLRDAPVDWVATYGRVASMGKLERFEILYPANKKYYYVTIHSPKKGYVHILVHGHN